MSPIPVFTFSDWLGELEKEAPEMPMHDAKLMFEDICMRRQYEPVGIQPDGEWLYRWVAPSRRHVVVVIVD